MRTSIVTVASILVAGWCSVTALQAGTEPVAAPRPSEPTLSPLTLSAALQRVRDQNPRLKSAEQARHAAAGRTTTARQLPNPSLVLESENFGGKGPRRGFDQTESTFSVSQPIELGGKRAKRTAIASLGEKLAGWDEKTAELDLVAEAALAFTEVLYAQEAERLAGDLYGLAGRAGAAAEGRVRAGKVSPLEQTRAQVAVASARLERERARLRLTDAKRQLATLWGSKDISFRAEGSIGASSPPPTLEELVASATDNPEIRRFDDEVLRQHANLSLEKARRIPDPTISVGVRRFEESDDNAFVAGLSIPLPVFNRNQGGVAEARAELARATYERDGALQRLQRMLGTAYAELLTAYRASRTLHEDVLPGAQRAYEAAEAGFRAGKFSFLDVLDAERTLFSARRDLVEQQAAYQRARITIDRLIGRVPGGTTPTPSEGVAQ